MRLIRLPAGCGSQRPASSSRSRPGNRKRVESCRGPASRRISSRKRRVAARVARCTSGNWSSRMPSSVSWSSCSASTSVAATTPRPRGSCESRPSNPTSAPGFGLAEHRAPARHAHASLNQQIGAGQGLALPREHRAARERALPHVVGGDRQPAQGDREARLRPGHPAQVDQLVDRAQVRAQRPSACSPTDAG